MSIAACLLNVIIAIGSYPMASTCDSFDVTAKVQNTSNGERNGSIDLSIDGDLGPYYFFWFGENRKVVLDFPSREDQIDLGPGRYYVVVQDKSCSETLEFEIE